MKCINPQCAKDFEITELGGQMPGNKESEEIICPYCGNIITRKSNGVFKTHKLTREQKDKI